MNSSQWEKNHQGAPFYPIDRQKRNGPGLGPSVAVFAVSPVVTEHQIIAARNGNGTEPIVGRRFDVRLGQWGVVDEDFAVVDRQSFSRESDDPLDVFAGFTLK